MRCLKNTRSAPPDFFRWTCPHDGYEVAEVDSTTWEEHARKHMKANGHPIPDDFRAQLEDQLCQSLPPQFCKFHDGKWVNTRLTWADVKNGTIAILKSFVDGFVPQEEAERRAKICVSCPFNVHVGGCTACKASKFVVGELAKKTTPYDARLRNCAICRCHLPAKVHVQKEILDSVTDDAVKQAYPSHCWLHEQ